MIVIKSVLAVLFASWYENFLTRPKLLSQVNELNGFVNFSKKKINVFFIY